MSPTAYRVRYLRRIEVTRDVASFRFERPAEYVFLPGQYASLTLQTRRGPITEQFSHSAAPADDYLEVTTRLTGSAFKNALASLRADDIVTLSGPSGLLTLPPGTRRVAFLTGGIGVTPIRCIVRDAQQRGTGLRATVFFGMQTRQDAPFLKELEAYAAASSEVSVVPVVADPEPGWAGERGFITSDIVQRHLQEPRDWLWMIVGPPPMLAPMLALLAGLVVPAAAILTESFSGYD